MPFGYSSIDWCHPCCPRAIRHPRQPCHVVSRPCLTGAIKALCSPRTTKCLIRRRTGPLFSLPLAHQRAFFADFPAPPSSKLFDPPAYPWRPATSDDRPFIIGLRRDPRVKPAFSPPVPLARDRQLHILELKKNKIFNHGMYSYPPRPRPAKELTARPPLAGDTALPARPAFSNSPAASHSLNPPRRLLTPFGNPQRPARTGAAT